MISFYQRFRITAIKIKKGLQLIKSFATDCVTFICVICQIHLNSALFDNSDKNIILIKKSNEPETITLWSQDIWYSGCSVSDEQCPFKLRKCNMDDDSTIHSLDLRCYADQSIHIEYALYGRPDSSLCCQGKVCL